MLSRKEAYQVLGVRPGSNKYEIERRYNVLSKSYRGRTDEAAMQEIKRFTLAYDILTGRYVEPEPEDPRLDDVILGKTRREWRNRWLYARTPVIISIIALVIIGSIIYSIVTKKDPDYVLQIFGTFVTEDAAAEDATSFLKDSSQYFDQIEVEAELDKNGEEIPPALERPLVSVHGFFQGNDAQMNQVASMKLMLVMSGADPTDLMMVDKAIYEQYLFEGGFKPLDDIYAYLLERYPEETEQFVEPLKATMPDEVRREEDPKGEFIYGLDFSKMQPFNALKIHGGSQIFTLPIRARNHAETFAIFTSIMEQAERLTAGKDTRIPTPTISPTPEVQATAE